MQQAASIESYVVPITICILIKFPSLSEDADVQCDVWRDVIFQFFVFFIFSNVPMFAAHQNLSIKISAVHKRSDFRKKNNIDGTKRRA